MTSAGAREGVWGTRARAWSECQEPHFVPLFDLVLAQTATGPGTAVLDVGCGSGLFCQMAGRRGAHVAGLDSAEPLLAIARERTPQGDFRRGDMAHLPFAAGSFDLVTGFNAFQFATDPAHAVREARRVTRPGGAVVIGVFGRPEDQGLAHYFRALAQLAPPAGGPGPFALSTDGALAAVVTAAGLIPSQVGEIPVPFEYPDETALLCGLLASGPGVQATERVGEAATRQAILAALAPFRDPAGGYKIGNTARYMIIRV